MATTTRSKKTATDNAKDAKQAIEANKVDAPVDDDAAPEALSKSKIRQLVESEVETKDWVWVDQWNSAVWFRPLTAGEHEQSVDYAVDPESGEFSQMRQGLKQIELACIDPEFSESDFAWLEKCKPSTLHVLVAGINILTGLRGGSVAALQARFPGPG